jgi:hypothetical protein
MTAVRKEPVELDRFVAALLALATERVAEKNAQKQLAAINLISPASEAECEAA